MAIFTKNQRTQIRVEKTEFKGHEYLHIREWWTDGGQWKPGKGIALPVGMAKEILEAAMKEVA